MLVYALKVALTAICVIAVSGLNGCVPIPWFPKNPYSPERISFLDDEEANREKVVAMLRQPWANLNDKVYVYLASKDSAHLVDFDGNYYPVRRDYFLVIDFDEAGRVSKFETFTDSLRHSHCFENGICLKRKSYNIPLAPDSLDEAAKQFDAPPDVCTVYIYRDLEGDGLKGEGYVDIWYRPMGQRLTRLATSIEHGYSHFEFEPSRHLDFRVNQSQSISNYGSLDNNPHTEGKGWAYHNLFCVAGDMHFLRIFVPEKNSRPIEFNSVDPELGKNKVREMHLLLERRSLPGFADEMAGKKSR